MNRGLDRTITVAIWLITILEALGLGLAGAAKFSGDSWQRMFVEWGYPVWFALAVGAAEVLGAVLLLVPRTVLIGAALLGAIMLGALITELRHPQLGWFAPALHLTLLTALVLLRRWHTVSAGRRSRSSGA